MKTAAILLSGLALAFGDVTPRSSAFNPKRLGEERSFSAPLLWLLSPGGKYVATAIDDTGFGLMETATGRDLGSVGSHDKGGRHDGNWGQSDRIFATTSGDGEVKVWDAATRKEIAAFKPHAGYT